MNPTKDNYDMNYEDSLRYVEAQFKTCHSFVHASNIIRKCKDSKASKAQAMQELTIKYAEYLKEQLSLKGFSDTIIKKRTDLLNSYYDFYDYNSKYNYNGLFSSQGKLRPTILEEFIFLLFKDYLDHIKGNPDMVAGAYGMGATKACTNLYFSPSDFLTFSKDPSIKINVRDQDFAIYRIVKFNVSRNNDRDMPYEAKVPVVAMEMKTYLDKGRLEHAIESAEKLKMENPYVHFIVVVETYKISSDVDPSYSKIDQIYVLRKCRDHTDKAQTIQSDVVIDLFHEAKCHLESIWSDVKTKLQTRGKII